MTDYDVIETSDDGQYRVVIMQDTDCERPMDSGDWWTASVLVHHWDHRHGYGWQEMYDPEGRYYAAMQRLQDDHASNYLQVEPDEAFKRWMLIYTGIEVFDVTIVNGYRDTSNALAWLEPSERERVGIPAEASAKDIIDIEITEHNRWAEGECYGYIVQQRTQWVKLDGDTPIFQNDDGSDGVREEWEDTDDSLWGLIGRDYAEQTAIEALAIAGQS